MNSNTILALLYNFILPNNFLTFYLVADDRSVLLKLHTCLDILERTTRFTTPYFNPRAGSGRR